MPDPHFTGTMTRRGDAYTATLTDAASGQALGFAGTQEGDGAVLTGIDGQAHWTMRVVRKDGALRFVVSCEYGFGIEGTVTRQGGGYALVQDRFCLPRALPVADGAVAA